MNRKPGTLDELAEALNCDERERAEKVFFQSSRYEYMFWDMAYKLEKWPV